MCGIQKVLVTTGLYSVQFSVYGTEEVEQSKSATSSGEMYCNYTARKLSINKVSHYPKFPITRGGETVSYRQCHGTRAQAKVVEG
jgi:hypothetical protein